jgi:hypothetical protein
MVEFYYNCSVHEASKHAPLEVFYGLKPTTRVDRLLPLSGAPAFVADRLIE